MRMVGLILLLAYPAQAQTNMALYQDQAVSCLLSVPDTSSAFVLASPSVMPYLETALVSGWTEHDKAVFRVDSTRQRLLPQLGYDVESAEVVYARARRKRLERTVSLTLQYSWISINGQILKSDRCSRTHEDTILRNQLASFENSSYPETVGVPPPSRWTRRYLEPAVLGAATVLTVFLFFNLRSSRASSGS